MNKQEFKVAIENARSHRSALLRLYVLMVNDAKLDNDLKKKILENFQWEDEENLYIDKKLQELRKKYLAEFRMNIKNDKEGNPIDLDIYSENS